jgi:hypothetical protein
MTVQIRKALFILCGISLMLGGCRKAPKPKSQAEIVTEASRDRRMVTNFVNAVRSIVEWRQSQPVAKTDEIRKSLIGKLVKKFDSVPTKDLPADLDAAWKQVQSVWHQLAKEPNASPDLLKKGEEATEKLNSLFAANGYPDVRL